MDKIKWGVLGTAAIARSETIPGMQQASNCELWAVAGRDAGKAQEFKDAFGFAMAYGSYDELLADKDVNSVYIPLPNDMHKEWVLKALAARKNVLCEKPLALSADEAKDMFACAKENGVLLVEAYAYLHSPFSVAVRDAVRHGDIGTPCFMLSEFVTSDYKPANIRMQKERGGGALFDIGCYTVSQILFYLGGPAEDVQACGELNDEGIDVLASGVMTLPSKMRAVFTCGMVLETEQDKRIDYFQIHGNRGEIRSQTRFNQEGTLSYELFTESGVKIIEVDSRQNYALEIEHFGRCVLDRAEPLVTEELSVQIAQVLDAAHRDVGY